MTPSGDRPVGGLRPRDPGGDEHPDVLVLGRGGPRRSSRRGELIVATVLGAVAGAGLLVASAAVGSLITGTQWRSCPDERGRAAEAAELGRLTERKLQILTQGDGDALGRILTVDSALITPAGDRWSRDELIRAVASGRLDFDRYDPGEMSVRIDCDHAVVTYRSRIEARWSGGVFEHDAWHTDSFERREGTWQERWSHTTAVGGFPPPGG